MLQSAGLVRNAAGSSRTWRPALADGLASARKIGTLLAFLFALSKPHK